VGLERGPLSLLSTTEELNGRKSSGFDLENREYGRREPSSWPLGTLYPQKLSLTSPTSVGRSVGIVRSRTHATEFSLVWLSLGCLYDVWRILVRWGDRLYHLLATCYKRTGSSTETENVYTWNHSPQGVPSARSARLSTCYQSFLLKFKDFDQLFMNNTSTRSSTLGSSFANMRTVKPQLHYPLRSINLPSLLSTYIKIKHSDVM
jgi:hypothetical protein